MLRFGKNTASIIAFAIICIIVILSAFGPMMNEYGYNDQDLDRANLPARIKGCEGINLLNGSTVLKTAVRIIWIIRKNTRKAAYWTYLMKLLLMALKCAIYV